jgi:hypothetical protein
MAWPLSFGFGSHMRHDESTASEGDIVSREHLVRLLLEQIERTFVSDGRDQALQQIAAMLHLWPSQQSFKNTSGFLQPSIAKL